MVISVLRQEGMESHRWSLWLGAPPPHHPAPTPMVLCQWAGRGLSSLRYPIRQTQIFFNLQFLSFFITAVAKEVMIHSTNQLSTYCSVSCSTLWGWIGMSGTPLKDNKRFSYMGPCHSFRQRKHYKSVLYQDELNRTACQKLGLTLWLQTVHSVSHVVQCVKDTD